MAFMVPVSICMVNKSASLGKNQRKGNRYSRKRKLATLGPAASARPKRRRQTNTPPRPDHTQPALSPLRTDMTLPPLPVPGPDYEVELPERLTEEKRGKRNWGARV